MKKVDFKRALKRALADKGMLQSELAEKIGYKHSSNISEITKNGNPSLLTIVKFAEGLGMKASAFIALGESDEQ